MSYHSAPPGFYTEQEPVGLEVYGEDLTSFASPLDSYYGQGAVDCGLFTTRRSNSRSGFRVFARVVDGRSVMSRIPPREDVCLYFSQFGIVVDCYLPESATNVAYVCFEEQAAMEQALAHPEHILPGGIALSVSRASPRPDYSVNTDRIFAKNIPNLATRQDLKVYFTQFGEVIDVYIPKDKATGSQKRFAFVTFREVRQARAALANEMHYLADGSCMQVMPAEARPSSGSFRTNYEPQHAPQQAPQSLLSEENTSTTTDWLQELLLASQMDLSSLLADFGGQVRGA
jgi:RNA recognition motif. (a.k.a. RRM, RBD, or RNP domain)